MSKPESVPHRAIAKSIRILGIVVLVSSAMINPWVGGLYRQDVVNFVDVMQGYCIWGLIVGTILFVLSCRMKGNLSDGVLNGSILFCTVLLIVLLDRLLLAIIGLPYWIPDPVIHYRHRPGASRIVRDMTGKATQIQINRYGHHDDDFPEEKPSGELRGLMVGDSITMGDGVHRGQTFANQMEGLLSRYGRSYDTYQMINTGVQGYSTSQELYVLEESLRFDPDFIAVGFCMNDVTLPFEMLGGEEATTAPHIDFTLRSGLGSAHFLTNYVLNATGYGRLIQKLRYNRFKGNPNVDRWSFDTEEMCASPPLDSRFTPGWKIVLRDLERMYRLARERDIPIILMILPNKFQLFNDRYKEPQKLLSAHARRHGIDCLDFTLVFEELFHGDVVDILTARGMKIPLLEQRLPLYEVQETKYFRDYHHLTPMGHYVVASLLTHYLGARGIVEIDAGNLQEEVDAFRQKNMGKYRLTITRNFDEFLRKTDALRVLGYVKLALRIYQNSLDFYEDEDSRARIRQEISAAEKELEELEQTGSQVPMPSVSRQ